jgi:RecB family exonuclease
VPWGFEWEFGYDEPFYLEVPGGLAFPFRGSVDRIDELEGGGYALWDYKTGQSDDYDQSNPLGDGQTLQWDLYARAFEAITGEQVKRSGYYFTSDEEHGFLLDLRHASSRETLDEEWEDLAAIFRQVGEGVFGRDFDGNVWTYELDRLERVLKAGEHLTPRSSA